MGLFGGGKKLIGLDIGSSSIKLLSGKLKKSALVVDQLVIIPLPFRSIDERGIADPDAVGGAMQTAISETGKSAKRFATAMHGGGIITKRIAIPKVPKKELPEQVKWEAEQVFPQDIDSMLVAHVLLGETTNVPGAPADEKGWDILLVGVREDEALTWADLVESSGGELKYMDLDSFVCADFLSQLVDAPADEAIAFVDVGASATRIGIQYSGNICFLREFPIGGNSFTDAIATTLGLSFENAEALKIQQDMGIPQDAVEAMQNLHASWKSEIQQCEDVFVTQNHAPAISRWYVFGGASLTPGLMEQMQDERFGERTFALPTADYLKANNKTVDSSLLAAWSTRLITAAGLSCRKG